MKKIAAVLLAALAAPLAIPASAPAADQPRVAFWVKDGSAFVGHASFSNGRMRLTPYLTDKGVPAEVELQGAVRAVTFSPDGRRVSFYDDGAGRFVALTSRAGYLDFADAPADEVRDRGAWLWRDESRVRRGPITMLDPGPGVRPAHRWVLAPPASSPGTPSVPVTFRSGDRDLSKYVTALAAHPRSGGIAAVEPYTVNGDKVTRRPAYLARVSNSLVVGPRLGSIRGARHLAISAGGTRLALVTRDGSRVQIFSLPGLTRLASYSNVDHGTVSFSPGGYIGLGGPNGTVVREPDGDRLVVPSGVTWFRFAPCVGDGCRQLP